MNLWIFFEKMPDSALKNDLALMLLRAESEPMPEAAFAARLAAMPPEQRAFFQNPSVGIHISFGEVSSPLESQAIATLMQKHLPSEPFDFEHDFAVKKRFETREGRLALAEQLEKALDRPVTKPDSSGTFPVSSEPRPISLDAKGYPIVSPLPPHDFTPELKWLAGILVLLALGLAYLLRPRRK